MGERPTCPRCDVGLSGWTIGGNPQFHAPLPIVAEELVGVLTEITGVKARDKALFIQFDTGGQAIECGFGTCGKGGDQEA